MSSEQAISYHSINIGNDTVGYKNTWDDWHIVPTSRPLVPPPEVRTSYIDIPGGDGSLDLTEALTGRPTYQNRTGSWEFIVMNGYQQWQVLYSDIMAYLHGRQFRAILDDDPNYYYEGRFWVISWQSPKDWSRITIGFNVKPYKMDLRRSDENWLWDPFNFEDGIVRSYTNLPVNGTTEITVINDSMEIVPEITVSSAMSVIFEGNTYSLSTGSNSIRAIKMKPGANTFVFSGNGTVTIVFYGGRF